MNIRLGLHLAISMILGLTLALFGLSLGLPGVLGAMILWFFAEHILKALLPVSFLSSAPGTQATTATYRGWGPKVVAKLGLHRSRSAVGDAARLATGIPLGVLSLANHNGSQGTGYLVLQRQPNGETAVTWHRRGKQFTDQPIESPTVLTVHRGREQQNAVQARMGYSVSVELAGDLYWVRPSDAELLTLVLPTKTTPATTTKR